MVLLAVLPTGHSHFFSKTMGENRRIITDLWLFAIELIFQKKQQYKKDVSP
jgi:hypothetical protein